MANSYVTPFLCILIPDCEFLDCGCSMTQLRELENSHHEKITELALQYLESTIKGSLEEEPPEQLRKVCSLGDGEREESGRIL